MSVFCFICGGSEFKCVQGRAAERAKKKGGNAAAKVLCLPFFFCGTFFAFGKNSQRSVSGTILERKGLLAQNRETLPKKND
jgi:hypothetical protein